MEEVWGGQSPIEERDYGEGTYAVVNGSRMELEVGANFQDSVKNLAIDAGLGKFRVFLNGEELRPSESPDVIEEGSNVEIRPYDVAG